MTSTITIWSMIEALCAFALGSALHSELEAFAVVLLTSWFLAFAASSMQLLSIFCLFNDLWVKSLRISYKYLFSCLLDCFSFVIQVTTVLAWTFNSANISLSKALTVHFQAPRFFAAAFLLLLGHGATWRMALTLFRRGRGLCLESVRSQLLFGLLF